MRGEEGGRDERRSWERYGGWKHVRERESKVGRKREREMEEEEEEEEEEVRCWQEKGPGKEGRKEKVIQSHYVYVT